jgi:CubicO group peptidase (beta-lactamase class C family)
MISRSTVATLLALGICLTLSTVHAPVTAADPAQAVDAIFLTFDGPASPGCAVGVARGDRPVLVRAYGSADLERDAAVTPDTIFEAGSVSKQITAAAVLLLARDGRLSLDDDVREHLPEVPDYGRTIRIRHLLNHTSGLRDWGGVLEAAGRPRGSRVYTQDDVLDLVSRQRGVNFRPGAEYLYSNTGYSLLPLVVERVSGVSFAEYTRRHIFDPLEMTRTSWRDDFTRVVKGRALAYTKSSGEFTLEMPFENVHGHGGLLTTVGDLLLWNANFESGFVGGQPLIDEMQRPARLANGRRISYGAGLVLSKYRGLTEVSHSGSTAGYRAFVARYPEEGISLAVLCNTATARVTELAHQVADVFLTSPPPGELSGPPVNLAANALAGREGLYRNLRTNEPIGLSVVNGALRTAGGEALVPLSESTFRFEGSARRLEFTPGAGSTTVRLFTDEGDAVPLQRVKSISPSADRLAQYQGEYHSDEADAEYAVALVDGTLVLRQRPSVRLDLTPSYNDAFTTSSGWIVRFTRDRSGRVDAMSLSVPRVRDLRFDRTK